MGVNAIKLKIMPSSLETDLEKIKDEVKGKIEKAKGKLVKIETEEIAFGLKALVIILAWPEEKTSDEVENLVSEIKGIGSVQLLDVRKILG